MDDNTNMYMLARFNTQELFKVRDAIAQLESLELSLPDYLTTRAIQERINMRRK